MGVSVGDVSVTLTANTTQFTQAFSAAQAKMGAVGSALTAIGARMSIALSLPLLLIGKSALQMAGAFETGMLKVSSITRATENDMAALTKQALFLGKTTAFTARQAADAMGFLAQAGNKAFAIFSAMPETLLLASAAALDLGTSADIVTNIMAGFGIEQKNLGAAVDTLVAAFTGANTNLQQLAQALKFVGPVAKGAGLQFNETTAALALMGNAGLQATLAGTGLRQIIAKLINPSRDAEKAIKDMGINVIKTGGGIIDLIGVIEQFEIGVARMGGAAQASSRIMQIFGVRAGPAMQVLLLQGSEALKDMIKNLEAAGGIAKEIETIQLSGYRGALLKMQSATEGVAISLGEAMIPAFKSFAARLVDVNQRFIQMSSATRNIILSFSGILIVLGPMLALLGLLIKLVTPIGLLVLALGTIGLIATVVVANWEAAKPVLLAILDEIGLSIKDTLGLDATSSISAVFGGLLGATVLVAWTAGSKKLTGVLARLLNGVSLIAFALKRVFIFAAVAFVFTEIIKVWEGDTSTLSGILKTFGIDADKELKTFSATVEKVKVAITGIYDAIRNNDAEGLREKLQPVLKSMGTDYDDLAKSVAALGSISSSTGTLMAAAFEEARRGLIALTPMLSPIETGMKKIGPDTSFHESLWNDMKTLIGNATKSIGEILEDSAKDYKRWVDAVSDSQNMFKGVFDFIGTTFEEFKNTISTTIDTIIEKFNLLPDAWNRIKKAFTPSSDITGLISKIFTPPDITKITQFTEKAAQELQSGIETANKSIREAVEGGGQQIRNYFAAEQITQAEIEYRESSARMQASIVSLNESLAASFGETKNSAKNLLPVDEMRTATASLQELSKNVGVNIDDINTRFKETEKVLQRISDSAENATSSRTLGLQQTSDQLDELAKKSSGIVKTLGNFDVSNRGAKFPGAQKNSLIKFPGRDATEFELILERITIDLDGVIALQNIISNWDFTGIDTKNLTAAEKTDLIPKWVKLTDAIDLLWSKLGDNLDQSTLDALLKMRKSFSAFSDIILDRSIIPDLASGIVKVWSAGLEDMTQKTDSQLTMTQDRFEVFSNFVTGVQFTKLGEAVDFDPLINSVVSAVTRVENIFGVFPTNLLRLWKSMLREMVLVTTSKFEQVQMTAQQLVDFTENIQFADMGRAVDFTPMTASVNEAQKDLGSIVLGFPGGMAQAWGSGLQTMVSATQDNFGRVQTEVEKFSDVVHRVDFSDGMEQQWVSSVGNMEKTTTSTLDSLENRIDSFSAFTKALDVQVPSPPSFEPLVQGAEQAQQQLEVLGFDIFKTIVDLVSNSNFTDKNKQIFTDFVKQIEGMFTSINKLGDTSKIKELQQSLDSFGVNIKEFNESLIPFNQLLEEYAVAIELANVKTKLFGAEYDALPDKITATKAAIIAIEIEMSKIVGTEASVIETTAIFTTKLNDLQDSLMQFASQAAGDNLVSILENHQNAMRQTVIETSLLGDSYSPLQDRISLTRDALVTLGTAFDDYQTKGLLSAEATSAFETSITGLQKKLQGLENNQLIQDVFESIGSTMSQALTTMVSGVLQGTQTIQDAFKNMVKNILLALANKALTAAIGRLVGLLGSSIGNFFTVDSTGGGASLAAENSIVARAQGGRLAKGQVSVVGEKGPELFQAQSAGTIIPNKMFGQSSEPTVEITIINQNGSNIEKKESQNGLKRVIELMITDNIRRDALSGGRGSQAIGQAFGLSRVGGTR